MKRIIILLSVCLAACFVISSCAGQKTVPVNVSGAQTEATGGEGNVPDAITEVPAADTDTEEPAADTDTVSSPSDTVSNNNTSTPGKTDNPSKTDSGTIPDGLLVLQSDSDIFSDSVTFYRSTPTTYQRAAAAERTVTVDGAALVLKYRNSLKYSETRLYDTYVCDGITCTVDVATGNIFSFAFASDYYKISSMPGSEAELRSTADAFIAKFTSDKLSEYNWSCTTHIVTTGENWAGGNSMKGFYVPASQNESVSGYIVDYTKSAGSIKSSDRFRVIIGNGYISGVILDIHSQDGINISAESVAKAVETAKASIPLLIGKAYSYVSSEVRVPCLVMENGIKYASMVATITLRDNDGNDFKYMETVMVPLS